MKNLRNARFGHNVDPVVTDFVRSLRQKLGTRVKRVVLFGSRARRDMREDSDYDLLIVVDKRDQELEEIVLDVEVETLNRTDRLVSGLVYSEEEWGRESQFPLGRNVTREGVEV